MGTNKSAAQKRLQAGKEKGVARIMKNMHPA
jgi:hypothetical protein